MPKIGEVVKPRRYWLYNDDNRVILPTLDEGFADSIITDPPYGLEFMGKGWDHGVPGIEFWEPILRILKPSGYLLAFGGTRTYHRLTCAIEDAGFEVRDCLMWLYGSGFPKGRGCLKPAWEPVILARKPGKKVLPLGIDECRVPMGDESTLRNVTGARNGVSLNCSGDGSLSRARTNGSDAGRYPANVVHDGSDEVLEAFAAFGESKSRGGSSSRSGKVGQLTHGEYAGDRLGQNAGGLGDTDTAARFFYCAKASKRERGEGNTHPTVKPLALMRWLVKLVTPPEGIVLDPFAGSGSTGVGALEEGRRFVGIDNDREHGYFQILSKRITKAYTHTQGV